MPRALMALTGIIQAGDPLPTLHSVPTHNEILLEATRQRILHACDENETIKDIAQTLGVYRKYLPRLLDKPACPPEDRGPAT